MRSILSSCVLALTFMTAIAACAPSDQPPVDEPSPDVDPYFAESSEISSTTAPQVIIRNVLQDRSGVYWLATWSGVVRFDGTTFTNVTNKDGLRRYRVFSLLQDRDDNIWIGTIGAGVYKYDGTTFTNYTTEDGLVDDTILAMFQDNERNLWFGGMGLTKFDGTNYTTFTEDDGFTSADVHHIAQSPDGTLWFGTRGALFQYDGTRLVNFTKKHGVNIDLNSYTPVIVDRQGHVWFSGSQGLFHYDGKTIQQIFQPACFSLLEDSRGRIWFSGGAMDGQEMKPGTTVLNRFDPADGLETLLNSKVQIEIKTGAVFGLTEDDDGHVWFGTGRGVGRITGETVRFYQPGATGTPG